MNRRTFFQAIAGATGVLILPEPPRIRTYSFASPEWIERERLTGLLTNPALETGMSHWTNLAGRRYGYSYVTITTFFE